MAGNDSEDGATVGDGVSRLLPEVELAFPQIPSEDEGQDIAEDAVMLAIIPGIGSRYDSPGRKQCKPRAFGCSQRNSVVVCDSGS